MYLPQGMIHGIFELGVYFNGRNNRLYSPQGFCLYHFFVVQILRVFLYYFFSTIISTTITTIPISTMQYNITQQSNGQRPNKTRKPHTNNCKSRGYRYSTYQKDSEKKTKTKLTAKNSTTKEKCKQQRCALHVIPGYRSQRTTSTAVVRSKANQKTQRQRRRPDAEPRYSLPQRTQQSTSKQR